MSLPRFLWEKGHWLTRVPGMYRAYLAVTDRLYPDGAVVRIPWGPLSGYRWQRHRCHQAWMAMGMYEPHVTRLIGEILQPGDVFYDVGANAGYFTLVAAHGVGPQGQVIAFEPVPFNAQVIQKQIALNRLEGICRVEAAAISSQAGSVSLVIPDRNANAHLSNVIAPHLDAGGARVEVKTITLDQYVAGTIRPRLVKMDVEGAELMALQGAGELLSSPNAPVLLVSTHSPHLEEDVKKVLAGHGYKMINLPGFKQMVYARPRKR